MKENQMKPKRSQRPTGPTWEGKGGNTGDKTTLSHAKQTSLMSSAAQVRPFAGKVFYLDLPSNRIAERLEADIKDLGGTVEKFFSKEIKYLVSNKREARYVHCLRHDSPVPSPDSGQSSPHPRSNPHRPGSRGDNKSSRSQGQAEAFVTSRGKSLVERVVKEQERLHMNKILSNALDWGVKILYIDDVLAYVQKKRRIISSQVPAAAAVKTSVRLQVKAESAAKQAYQKYKGGRISRPFIKVEDSSRHYRPICLTMPNMPEFNLRTVAPCSPFCPDEKDPPGNKQRGQRGAKASGSEEKAHGRKKNRDKKRGGYCECCMIKYDSLTMHLQGERHKAFSKSDKYVVVDRLVSSLHCDFIHINTKVKRPKCSVSSAVIVPGPRGRTDLRQKGDVDPSETVDGDQGPHSGNSLEMRSIPDSSSRIHVEGDRRNCNTHSGRSKHKSLARKRPCRQNSLTSCTQLAQIPQVKPDTGHSIPSRVPQTHQVDHASHKDTSNSTSQLHRTNMQNERSINGETNVREDPDVNKLSLPDGNVFPEKADEKNLPEKEEDEKESVPARSFSPVRKIQRRVRVYKRKRRKVDTKSNTESRESRPDSSLNLWKLFQSSDDMDVEFRGFPD